ncbi:MAG: hypothetical protein WCT85_03945 [Parachlamydiales bacterium]|jgi:hypothetical protein
MSIQSSNNYDLNNLFTLFTQGSKEEKIAIYEHTKKITKDFTDYPPEMHDVVDKIKAGGLKIYEDLQSNAHKKIKISHLAVNTSSLDSEEEQDFQLAIELSLEEPSIGEEDAAPTYYPQKNGRKRTCDLPIDALSGQEINSEDQLLVHKEDAAPAYYPQKNGRKRTCDLPIDAISGQEIDPEDQLLVHEEDAAPTCNLPIDAISGQEINPEDQLLVHKEIVDINTFTLSLLSQSPSEDKTDHQFKPINPFTREILEADLLNKIVEYYKISINDFLDLFSPNGRVNEIAKQKEESLLFEIRKIKIICRSFIFGSAYLVAGVLNDESNRLRDFRKILFLQMVETINGTEFLPYQKLLETGGFNF